MKAEDIGSFDVIPSWEREEKPCVDPVQIRQESTGCGCGLCQLAAGGHL